MDLSEESIQEFIEIYKQEFGEELSRDNAEDMAKKLLSLYRFII